MCETVAICGMDALELNVPVAPSPTNYADTQCSYWSGPLARAEAGLFLLKM